MKTDTNRRRRIKPRNLSFFLILTVVLVCISFFTMPISGQAAWRDKPTPTPAAISPNSVDIIGGEQASAGEYPWQAALVYSSYSNPYLGQFCGGSLIAQQWVLTAGHCVVNDEESVVSPSSMDVVLGINNLSDGPTYGDYGQRIGVQQIYLYPGFNYGSNDGLNQDAALLKLESAAVLNSLVSTIALASPSDTSQVQAGVMSTVTGWGSTSESGGYPDSLMEVQVPIVAYSTCAASYSGMFNLSNNYHLCAGYSGGGKDSCYGDSGGPLIVPNGSGWLQAGIVSFGEGCARANYYGIYSKVSYFKPWIDATIGTTSGEVENPVYMPLLITTTSGTSQSCTPDPSGESNNISDALIICSGNTVSGSTSYPNDLDDVYKIYVSSGKKLTITMTGSGGDSDLYLFPPGTVDVTTDDWFIRSTNYANSESINATVNQTGYWYVDIFRFEKSSVNATNYQVSVAISN